MQGLQNAIRNTGTQPIRPAPGTETPVRRLGVRRLATILLAAGAVAATCGGVLAQSAAGPKAAGQGSVRARRGSVQMSAAADPANRTRVLDTYSRLPLRFEVNQGQADPRARFVARTDEYNLFLTAQGAVLELSAAQTRGAGQARGAVRTLAMQLLGSDPSAVISGLDEMTGKSNYLIGNDPANWRLGVANYAKVRYRNAYPGIDVVYYGNQRRLEYDFVVAAGADPRLIQIALAGASASADHRGDLVLEAGRRSVRLTKPIAYQTDARGGRQNVRVEYVLGRPHARGNSRQIATFRLAAYDHARPLIIDPVALVRSTYLGGSGKDAGYGIGVDSAGNAYVAGSTASLNFPTAACFQCANAGGIDAFVTAINAGGTAFIYSTYLGGSGTDVAYGIAADVNGFAFVTGSTTSRNFPLVFPLQPVYGGGGTDAFVTELSPAGAPVYSTYLGGAKADVGYGIAVDSADEAHVTGSTTSLNFPLVACAQCANAGGTDAFVSELKAGGTGLVFSTYLGGSSTDIGYGIAVDANHNVGVTGSTASLNFPTKLCLQCANAGSTDAFATFYSPVGALSWSSYWGGSAADAGYSITMDSVGEGWITGYTKSNNFPVVTANCVQCGYAGNTDAILVRFQYGLATFSDFLGGTGTDVGRGVVEANAGLVYLTGSTTSINFPMVSCFQCVNAGGTDAFAAEYQLIAPYRFYSTYFGGTGTDLGYGIALGPAGEYIAGSTTSTNLPIRPPCTQCAAPGAGDAFVAVLH
ncbi:MAG TPA: SBBP repeat-containing protein [Terriglobia bacterium]|nr:SBBP repeat-containing protein [Terriglobia bacterium]